MLKETHTFGIFPRAAASLLLGAVLAFFIFLLPADAEARPAYQPLGQCTDAPEFKTDIPPGTPGTVTNLVTFVQSTMSSASQNLYNKIIGDSGFKEAVSAILTLYIAVYGILFSLGIARASAYNFIKRLIKVALIVLLIQGNSWSFFNTHVVAFFENGLNEYINTVMSMVVGGSSAGGQPILTKIDQGLAKIISANMLVHVIATAFTSSYGLVHAILLVIALWAYLGLLLTGLWVYLISLVLRAFLFGVAPLFIICLLFKKTEPYFVGWLNQVFNTVLQPIMIFTFLTFFILVLEQLSSQIINVPVCRVGTEEAMQGTPYNIPLWRYKAVVPGTNPPEYELFSGKYDLDGPEGVNGQPVFPINIITLLLFLIVAELGGRFTQVVLIMSKNLSASSLDAASMTVSLGSLIPSIGTKVADASAAAAEVSPTVAKARELAGGAVGSRNGAAAGGTAAVQGAQTVVADASGNAQVPGGASPAGRRVNVMQEARERFFEQYNMISNRNQVS